MECKSKRKFKCALCVAVLAACPVSGSQWQSGEVKQRSAQNNQLDPAECCGHSSTATVTINKKVIDPFTDPLHNS
eukprot:scaffold1187_cov181-Ochromonas_danica.AAC.30